MRKILVVDDNKLNLALAKKLLEKHGYEVDTADSGKSTLMTLAYVHYHLILMDIELDRFMNGFETSEIIKAFVDVPILAYSTLDDIENKCKEVGIDDYLHKPAKPHELLEAIENNLKNLNRVDGTLKDVLENLLELLFIYIYLYSCLYKLGKNLGNMLPNPVEIFNKLRRKNNGTNSRNVGDRYGDVRDDNIPKYKKSKSKEGV